jgi:hypothetical protein
VYFKFACLGRCTRRFSLPYVVVVICWPRVCDVSFSSSSLFFLWPALEYKLLIVQGCIVICVSEFWMLLVCFFNVCRDCVACTNGFVELKLLMFKPACISCDDVYSYSAAVCCRGVQLCMFMFCIVIIYGVYHRI